MKPLSIICLIISLLTCSTLFAEDELTCAEKVIAFRDATNTNDMAAIEAAWKSGNACYPQLTVDQQYTWDAAYATYLTKTLYRTKEKTPRLYMLEATLIDHRLEMLKKYKDHQNLPMIRTTFSLELTNAITTVSLRIKPILTDLSQPEELRQTYEQVAVHILKKAIDGLVALKLNPYRAYYERAELHRAIGLAYENTKEEKNQALARAYIATMLDDYRLAFQLYRDNPPDRVDPRVFWGVIHRVNTMLGSPFEKMGLVELLQANAFAKLDIERLHKLHAEKKVSDVHHQRQVETYHDLIIRMYRMELDAKSANPKQTYEKIIAFQKSLIEASPDDPKRYLELAKTQQEWAIRLESDLNQEDAANEATLAAISAMKEAIEKGLDTAYGHAFLAGIYERASLKISHQYDSMSAAFDKRAEQLETMDIYLLTAKQWYTRGKRLADGAIFITDRDLSSLESRIKQIEHQREQLAKQKAHFEKTGQTPEQHREALRNSAGDLSDLFE